MRDRPKPETEHTNPENLRVAMVTETYPPEVNGVARTVAVLASGLRQRGHVVQLQRPRQRPFQRPGSEARGDENLVPSLSLPRYPQLRLGLPATALLLRSWKAWKPDVVHVATEGPLGWSAVTAAKKLRIPVTTDFHTNFHAYLGYYGFGWLQRAVVRYLRCFHNRSECTLVPTGELSDSLAQQHFQRLRVVGRGVDCDAFSPAFRSRELRSQWGVQDEAPVAIHVGRLAPEKNLPLIMDAFHALRQIRPEAKLVLVGDGPLRSSLESCGEGFVFAGKRVGRELAEYYASADLFLFPSVTETFGNVTLEAMASGLAIVAYHYAAARKHLVHRQSALLPGVNRREDFLAAVALLAQSPALISRFRLAARISAEEWPWDRAVGEFEEGLRDVATQRNLHVHGEAATFHP